MVYISFTFIIVSNNGRSFDNLFRFNFIDIPNNFRSFDNLFRFNFLEFPNDFRSFDNPFRFNFLEFPNDFKSFDNYRSCSFHYGFFFPIGIACVLLETFEFLAISTPS